MRLEIEILIKWRKFRFVQNLVGNLLVSQWQLKTNCWRSGFWLSTSGLRHELPVKTLFLSGNNVRIADILPFYENSKYGYSAETGVTMGRQKEVVMWQGIILIPIFVNTLDFLKVGMRLYTSCNQYSTRKHSILTIFHSIELMSTNSFET